MTYGWQNHPELDRVARVEEQRPPQHPWGCRTSDDSRASQEVVLWFSTPQELVTWFAHGDPGLEEYADEKTRNDQRARLQLLVDELADGEIESSRLGERLSELLSSWLALSWLGTFEELCSADRELEASVRSEFRKSELDRASEAPISEGEKEAFARFLDEEWRV